MILSVIRVANSRRLLVLTPTVLLVLSCGLFAQPVLPAMDDLHGPVSQVVIEEQILAGSNASSQGSGTRREILRFDDGRLVEQSNYRPEDTLLWKTIFDYDSNGRLATWTSVDQAGHLRWRYQYSYTPEGRIEREVARGPGDIIEGILVYEYVGDRLKEETMYGPDNRVRWRKAYRYDDERTMRSWSMFHADGTRIKHVEEEFDEQGRIVRESHTDGLGGVYKEVHYEYGVWNTPLRVEVFDGSGALIRDETYELDTTGRVVSEEITRYDTKRHVEISRDLTYDEYGNWIRKFTRSVVTTDQSEQVTREKLVDREITYTGEDR